jgi:hypothetical protein
VSHLIIRECDAVAQLIALACAIMCSHVHACGTMCDHVQSCAVMCSHVQSCVIMYNDDAVLCGSWATQLQPCDVMHDKCGPQQTAQRQISIIMQSARSY